MNCIITDNHDWRVAGRQPGHCVRPTHPCKMMINCQIVNDTLSLLLQSHYQYGRLWMTQNCSCCTQNSQSASGSSCFHALIGSLCLAILVPRRIKLDTHKLNRHQNMK